MHLPRLARALATEFLAAFAGPALAPIARLSTLADASQGASTDAWDQGTPGRGSWNPQLAPWVFSEDPLAVPGPELMRSVAQAHPLGRFSQYTTVRDGVQFGLYGLIRSR